MVTSALLLTFLLPTADAAERELPVRTITAFKDGHALIVREGEKPVSDGSVLLNGLPSPLLGTFWPYATGQGNEVVSATAAQIPVTTTRVIASVAELLAENLEREVTLTVQWGESEQQNVQGELVAITSGGGNGQLALLKEKGTTFTVPLNKILSVQIDGETVYEVDVESTTPGLRLKLKKGDVPSASVGLMYVQKGFRWIPQYRMTLGPDGKANYVLRATLVNDVIDLENATVNLVVGVPMFAFAGQIDPISLGTNVAQITRASGSMPVLSNGFQIQSQMSYGAGRRMPTVENSSGPEVSNAKRSEDLYVFTVDNVTLGKGERMSIEVSRGTIQYEHAFSVDLPVLPPAELGNVDQQRKELVAKLLSQPQVKHELKIVNNNREPLTTAPTLLSTVGDDGEETLLAQSHQFYTPPGGESRIDLGTAIEINVQFDEEEVSRQAEVRKHGGRAFDQVNLKGTITVCNHRPEKSTLVVRRYVPGPLDAASMDGTLKTLAPFDSDAGTAGLSGRNISANWWYGYRPNWYSSLNPVSRAEWTLELDPEEVQEPTYEWHYFWRW